MTSNNTEQATPATPLDYRQLAKLLGLAGR